jgi:serine/threonine protein kinase/tetratricopeptide (TPR) repeat protein
MDARSRRSPPSIPGYRIVRALGDGGMATAWLAVQESLGREVALKVLDPVLAADGAFVERFLREARVLASLRHRHIVAIHDVALVDGVPYLAMEYLAQGSIVPLCGRCDAATALRCVREIADALGHAHARGIIHRDVKPENILRGEDGDFVLGDFGIARVSDGGALAAPTAPGLAFGTPAYMAPERWRDGPVDGRSDFYSLGCVLHALLTARPPFEASEQVALGHKHLSDPIPLLPAPFEALQGLLARLLAKDPADRHPDAAAIVTHVQALERELGADGRPSSGETRLLSEWPFGAADRLLDPVPAPASVASPATSRSRWLAIGFAGLAALALGIAAWFARGDRQAPSPPPAPSGSPVVAVLPFTAEGDDADLDRLADVLSEDLTAQLARQAGVPVVARTSVLAAPSTGDLRELARRLGAERLVVGEMALSGQTLELALRIVDARTGMARWRGAVAGQPDRLWQLESRAVQALATDLLPGRTPAPTEIAGRALDAYPDYLRGRKLLASAGGEQSMTDAVSAFRAALAADPTFAPAFAGICRAELRLFEQRRDPEAHQRATDACERAVSLDPALAEVVLAQGDLLRLAGEQGSAIDTYERILRDPLVGADALVGKATALANLGRMDEAEAAFAEAQGRMPGYWRVYFGHGNVLLALGRAEAAIEKYRMAQRFAPQAAPRVANNLGSAYLTLGRFEEAAAAYEAALGERRSYSAVSNLGTARFYLGDYAAAAALYQESIALAPEDYRPYGNLADAQSLTPALAAQARGNYEEAARRAEKFLTVQSDSVDAATELAWYWVNLGDRERARIMADGAMERVDSGARALRLAGVYRRLGMADQANAAVQRATELGIASRIVESTPWLGQ